MASTIGNLMGKPISPCPSQISLYTHCSPIYVARGRQVSRTGPFFPAQVWVFPQTSLEMGRFHICDTFLAVSWFVFKPFPHTSIPTNGEKEKKQKQNPTVSLVHLKLFSLLCPRSHSAPLPGPTIFEARFSAFGFLWWARGLCQLPRVCPISSGSHALPFLFPQPALCTWSQVPRATSLPWTERRLDASVSVRHLEICLWLLSAAFSGPGGGLLQPLVWSLWNPSSSLGLLPGRPGQLLLGHLILAVKFMVLILLSKAFLRHIFFFLQYIQ